MCVFNSKIDFNNKRIAGFALVQVLTSSVIISVVALSVAAILYSGFKGVTNNRNIHAADDIAEQITILMESTSFCTAQFQSLQLPLSLPGVVKSNLSLKKTNSLGALTSEDIFEASQNSQALVKISGFDLSVDYLIGPRKYLGSLNISMTAEGGNLGSLYRSVSLVLYADSVGKIASCSRVSSYSVESFEPGEFSLTCNDFLTKGWSSRSDCLKDGRWHLVYSTDENGSTLTGSSNEFLEYIRDGATAKVGTREGPVEKHEICQVIMKNPADYRELACIGATRTDEFNWVGATRRVRGIDGAVYMNTGNIYTRSQTKPASLRWYVKF